MSGDRPRRAAALWRRAQTEERDRIVALIRETAEGCEPGSTWRDTYRALADRIENGATGAESYRR